MIILNEVNRFKKYIYKKSGVKLPKGGADHHSYSTSPYYDTILNNEFRIKNLKNDIAFGDREPTTKNTTLHYNINRRSSKHPEHNLRKDALMKKYGYKLTHKYDKQSTPNVEAPKSTSKPFVVPNQEPQVHTDAINNLKNKNLSKPTPGLGRDNTIVFGEPAPKVPKSTSKPPKVEAPKDTSKPPKIEAPKDTSKPPKIEAPKSTSKPPKVEAPKSNMKTKIVPKSNVKTNSSWLGRNKGKVALGIGVTTAAAYGIHRYRKNKKKKEEEARRQG